MGQVVAVPSSLESIGRAMNATALCSAAAQLPMPDTGGAFSIADWSNVGRGPPVHF